MCVYCGDKREKRTTSDLKKVKRKRNEAGNDLVYHVTQSVVYRSPRPAGADVPGAAYSCVNPLERCQAHPAPVLVEVCDCIIWCPCCQSPLFDLFWNQRCVLLLLYCCYSDNYLTHQSKLKRRYVTNHTQSMLIPKQLNIFNLCNYNPQGLRFLSILNMYCKSQS